MVSFSCEACGDILTKKKLDPHRNQCRGASFTCIDCMVHFQGTQYRSHTSCISEAQKYQGALYKEKPKNNQRKGKNDPKQNSKNTSTNNEVHQQTSVEEAPDAANPQTNAPPPPVPTPPPAAASMSSTATGANGEKSVNVFDYLVTAETPNASRVSVGSSKEPMRMVDHAPSVFEASQALTRIDTEDDEEGKTYDVAYEENGFSYGAEPIKPSVYPSKASNPSMEFMTPAPKKKKKDRKDNHKTGSDKKRKRGNGEDVEMDAVSDEDTPMMDVPSSTVNNAGTPTLNHSGLTGGLNRMLRSPSADGGEESNGKPHQDASSPIKRTRCSDKETNSEGKKSRAERRVSSMLGASGTSNEATSKALIRTRRNSSEAVETRKSSKKTHRSHKRSSQNGQMVVYRHSKNDEEVQYDMASQFLSLVTKGPESERGISVHKALKRLHHRVQGRDSDRERRIEDERDLWRSLRLKRNERGEVVVFV